MTQGVGNEPFGDSRKKETMGRMNGEYGVIPIRIPCCEPARQRNFSIKTPSKGYTVKADGATPFVARSNFMTKSQKRILLVRCKAIPCRTTFRQEVPHATNTHPVVKP